MATKTIKYDSFKRGDTPTFGFLFQPPFVGFSWSPIKADLVITSVNNPTNNASAAAVRLNQTLTVNADNTSYIAIQPTVAESNTLIPGTIYRVEVQLKEGTTNVVTPVTGEVLVEQDYII